MDEQGFFVEAFMNFFIHNNIFVSGMGKHTVVDKFGIKPFEYQLSVDNSIVLLFEK